MSAKVGKQILSKEELAIWKTLQSKSIAARKNLQSNSGVERMGQPLTRPKFVIHQRSLSRHAVLRVTTPVTCPAGLAFAPGPASGEGQGSDDPVHLARPDSRGDAGGDPRRGTQALGSGQ